MLAPMLEEKAPEFPFIALLVSGGHTMLAEVKGIGQYTILGQTLDDAVGEAFDKTAKILGLSYPGGPAISKIAENGNPQRFKFPRPMVNRPGLDFSYSGLKTFALTTVQKQEAAQSEQRAQSEISAQGESISQYGNLDQQTIADIAYAFQDAAVDVLSIKSRRALQQTGVKRLVVAGGVGANKRLREQLSSMATEEHAEVYYPRIDFCTDNGAMIAFAGAQRMHQASSELSFQVKPRWSLEDLPPV